MKMPKVYLTSTPPMRRAGNQTVPVIDLRPAEVFGELVYLSHRMEVENGTEGELMWKMRERLKDFDPRLDYLMPIGHTITMITAAIAALEIGDGTVRLMQWDRRLNQYEVFRLDINVQPEQKRA